MSRPTHRSKVGLGEGWRTWGDGERGLNLFREAVTLDPNLANGHNALGQAFLDAGKTEEAGEAFRKAVQANPNYARAHNNLGRSLFGQNKLKESIEHFREAVRINPRYDLAHNNLGAALLMQGQVGAAGESFRAALALRPTYPEAHANLANVLKAQGNYPAAVTSYAEAVRLKPSYLKALIGLGDSLTALGQFPQALAILQEARKLQPNNVEVLSSLGAVFLRQAQWEIGLTIFEEILQIQPDHPEAFACSARLRELVCDWSSRDADFEQLWADVPPRIEAKASTAITPFNTWSTPWGPERILAVAKNHAAIFAAQVADLGKNLALVHPKTRQGRLKVGYISYDFRDHATSHQMSGLFALHNREKFEIFGYSFGPNDNSRFRQRVVDGCDHFIDIAGQPTADIARRIHADGIHILVDLNGLSGNSRPDMFAIHPAPIQVSYFYAATMGADFIDYLVTDRVVTPPGDEQYFAEKLVFMPHTYYVTDHQQHVSPTTPDRVSQGLPATGFVFACFNNSYKLEPDTFSAWMRILKAVPGSVLWLLWHSITAETNLRKEAQQRGIDPARLVFAPPVPKADHLARHLHADLFLDNRDINAHTTACDALWMDLPVLTLPGRNYAGRVAASLLTAIGLPELIANSLEQYETIAIELALDKPRLQALRDQLASNRDSWALFDSVRFAKNLERAYVEMWNIYAAGEKPHHITIEDGPPSPDANSKALPARAKPTIQMTTPPPRQTGCNDC